jgi:2-polyprenyl-6-methoxyphenol hydroxylase-like FAD-dependent oxidoreductase
MARGASFGFGLAFSDRALAVLEAADPETWRAARPAFARWSDSILSLEGREVRIDGMGYAGIGRGRLLDILTARAMAAGVVPHYETRVDDLDAFGDADLIVGADGAHSVLRRTRDFGTRVRPLGNRFIWFGTRKRFSALGHSFVSTPWGVFNAHHHPHADAMSTFVVEADAESFARAGLETMPPDDARAFCARIFAHLLEGEALLSNASVWRRYARVDNAHWFRGNGVLIGDALHSVHYSIGSGTRVALEDALALAAAILAGPDMPAALAAFEAARKPAVIPLLAAAEASALWYEDFGRAMRLPLLAFAMSYATRSGRVDRARLARSSPEFLATYEAEEARDGAGASTPRVAS